MSEMATHYENVIKKQVGQTRSDVWDRLYPLNCFIGQSAVTAADDRN